MLQRRLLRELKGIQNDKNHDYVVGINGTDLTKWSITLFGAPNTPWEGAVLKLEMTFTDSYPNKAPHVKFVDHIPFHPNIYGNGNICLNILKDEWSSVYGVDSIMTSIQTLLNSPNPDSPANNSAGVMFTKEPHEYERKVRQFVKTTWSSSNTA